MTNTEKLAYFVGLLDGEGNLRIDLRHDKRGFAQHHARMTIANTDKKMIDWLLENYGGYVWSRKNMGNPNWRQIHFWIKTIGREHKDFIDSLIPFAITKRDRIILFREFLETKSTNGVRITEEVRTKRDEIMLKLNSSNDRGNIKQPRAPSTHKVKI